MSENILDRLRQLQIEILGVERRPSLDDVRWSHWLSDRRWYFLLSISVGIQRWWFQLATPTSTRFDVRSVHEQHCFRLNSVSLQYEGVRLPKNIWDPNGYNMTQMILYNYNWRYWSYPNLCMIYIYMYTHITVVYIAGVLKATQIYVAGAIPCYSSINY